MKNASLQQKTLWTSFNIRLTCALILAHVKTLRYCYCPDVFLGDALVKWVWGRRGGRRRAEETAATDDSQLAAERAEGIRDLQMVLLAINHRKTEITDERREADCNIIKTIKRLVLNFPNWLQQLSVQQQHGQNKFKMLCVTTGRCKQWESFRINLKKEDISAGRQDV